MKKLTLALTASLVTAFGASVHAADLAAGQEAFQKYTCASCHGADAKTSTLPSYPILAGQHADYLAHSLKAYKRGQAGAPASSNVRKNAVMGAMVQQLSDEDIANISAWLASLPSPLSVSK
ncbi:MAG TPA: cytochrome c [Pusillimonas sp.]|uniref:c-type cytochrome n=1 Tax=unclassified Pusillimonas TaxID=2640016 RepID=UPI0026213DA6|nr:MULTISPECIES: cytochrome c [unclassified Pusillimonas]HLU20286.1 cytochrome c [Pusillimonas sp.]